MTTFLTSLERSKWPVEDAGTTKALEMAARSARLQKGARYGSAYSAPLERLIVALAPAPEGTQTFFN